MVLSLARPLENTIWFLDRYSLLEQIGCGGFGQVYLAFDTHRHEQVCVKCSQSSLATEARLLAEARHTRTPGVHGLYLQDGWWYLVMDYLPGETLTAYQDRLEEQGQAVSVEDVLQIGWQIASILQSFHERTYPLVVSDIKPDNIIRRPDGAIFLIDFGIARLAPLPTPGAPVVGSRGFLPLECYSEGRWSPALDIYALGATLHQLLTGELPCKCVDGSLPCGPACFAPTLLRGPVGEVIMWMLAPLHQDRPLASTLVRVFGQLLQERAQYSPQRKRFYAALAGLSFF
jgi:serine/threonine protein kinase